MIENSLILGQKLLLIVNSRQLETVRKFNFNPISVYFEIVPTEEFYFKKILKNPLVELWRVRQGVSSARKFTTWIFETYSAPQMIYIFSDKDIFTQYFIQKAKNKNPPKIVAIEEGTSFYVSSDKTEKYFNFLYNMLTPILLGFRYQYVCTYGSSKFVDEIYLRFPEYLPKNRLIEKKQVSRISLTNKTVKIDKASMQILFLSSPLTEYLVTESGIEKVVLRELIDLLQPTSYNISLKPHPNENLKKFEHVISDSIEIEVIDKDIPTEDIDLSRYRLIVNFASSAVIDIVEKQYPVKNIITINPYSKNLSLTKLYEQTNYICMPTKGRILDSETVLKIRNFLKYSFGDCLNLV